MDPGPLFREMARQEDSSAGASGAQRTGSPQQTEAASGTHSSTARVLAHPRSPAFRRVCETQAEAARRIAPLAPGKRLAVFRWIEQRGEAGSTDHESAAATGFPLQTICGRRNELMEMGLVRDSGARRTTPSGCSAVVWVVTGP